MTASGFASIWMLINARKFLEDGSYDFRMNIVCAMAFDEGRNGQQS